ncbi:hypothetical protein [Marinicella sp. W31]|uniref:CBU_0592 family membrane protein n=1 Tax=Marinicella sp. W31 TaxID=3023713 RepID=UPI003757212A
MISLIVNILGWVGSVCLIAAYWMNSTNRLSSQSFTYQILNLTGSIFLIINSTYYHAYPSSFVNVVWAVVAITSLRQNKTIKQTKIS